MKEYIIDGTILFIREYTGNKKLCLRIPSSKSQAASTSISDKNIPDPQTVEIAVCKLRPATFLEYKVWQQMTSFQREQATTIWPISQVYSDKITIQGVTLEWIFDHDKYPSERTPDIVK